MDELRILAKRNRRTLSGEAQLAFEKHLAASGVDGISTQRDHSERR